MSPDITTKPYERSHGTTPRGTGRWAFQATRTWVAFDADLFGEVAFIDGTFTEAKAQAAEVFTDAETVAVLP
jgi:hypothetical protein